MSSDCEKRFSLRQARADDEAFLFELYSSTRAEEMAQWGLGPEQKEMFLQLQFRAQRGHYEMAYPEAEHQIILSDGERAGRLLVFRSEREIEIVDIALLPDQRGKGIGEAVISDIIDEAREASKPVSLHVTKENRARRLYERLGFEIIQDTGVYFKMECRPGRKSDGEINND